MGVLVVLVERASCPSGHLVQEVLVTLSVFETLEIVCFEFKHTLYFIEMIA